MPPKRETKRQFYEKVRGQLAEERVTFEPHWRELADHTKPRRMRYFTSDVNRGDRRNSKIIDSTATTAARTLASGMMAGITSPARSWFRLTVPDPAMAEIPSVKAWLHETTQTLETVFARASLYKALPIVYGDIGTFGTSAMMVEEDFDTVMRCYVFPLNSYYLGLSDRLKVEVFFREFTMTVRQMVEKFGNRDAKGKIDWSNFSLEVRNLYDEGQLEKRREVCHIILPNDDYNPKKLESKFKKFTSCYYEKGSGMPGDEDKYLRESGYDYFPVLAPRWEVSGEDVYGTNCPGMEALGDIKQLQVAEKKILNAIAKMVDPPLKADPTLRQEPVSMLAGGISFVSERDGKSGLSPLHEVNPQVQHLEMKQDSVRRRIKRIFFEDLFLMMASDERTQPPTAEEIVERRSEKMIAVGPVLEQFNDDVLDPLIDLGYTFADMQGLIKPAPEEIAGRPLKVEYISIMAQAQKMMGIASVERFIGFVRSTFEVTQDPSVLDKVDFDQTIDEYGDALGVPPQIVRSDEAVAEIRAGRAEANRKAALAEQVPAAAKAAKDLAGAEMGGDNALTRLMQDANAGNPVPA